MESDICSQEMGCGQMEIEYMRVVELENLKVNISGDAVPGSDLWYTQQLPLAMGFFEYDVSESIWYVNTMAKSLLSLHDSEKEVVGSLFENDSLDIVVMDFLQGKKLQLTREILVRKKNKPWEKFLIRGDKAYDSEGRPKIRGAIFDVTHKASNDLVDTQLQKLQSLGQLTSGVSHDFNNQLNGILGYVTLMKNMVGTPKLLHYLEGIERSVSHATALTRQLLTFAHKSVEEYVNVDLSQIVQDTFNMLTHTIDKRIKLNLTIEEEEEEEEEEEGFNVIGDASLMNNAILNLCLNARDAIPSKGEITLTLKRRYVDALPNNVLNGSLMAGKYAVIEVRDTGYGMDEELQKKIIRPFFTTKGVGKGTGMGLAQVVEALQKHHGALTIDSKVGAGSAFTVYLPLIRGFEEDFSASEQSAYSGRILLIDDELSNLEITTALLNGCGYSVKPFSNPKEAVEHFARHEKEYDCILLDVIMPEMSGIEVFKAMKLINPHIKIVLLTGVTNPFELDFILRQGGDAYLTKPIDHNQLSRTVFEVINSETVPRKPVSAQKLIETATIFNVERSLERIAGNVGLYLKIALRFRKEFYTIVEQFPQLIESNRVEAIRKVHTIKGLAAQVGADELAMYAEDLEADLNAGKTSEELQELFLEEFVDVADELLRMEKVV